MDELRVLENDEVVRGRFGTAYITKNGERKELFNAEAIEVTGSVDVEQLDVLNRVMPLNVPGSVSIKVSLTIMETSHDYSDLMYEYIETGIMPAFDLQITNDDPRSKYSAKTVVVTNCIATENVFAQLKAGESALKQDVEAVADGVKKLSSY